MQPYDAGVRFLLYQYGSLGGGQRAPVGCFKTPGGHTWKNAKSNRDTVISALIYPAILAVVSVLSIVVMLGFVVPQFETLFEDMGEALPPLTQMVIGGADFIKSYGVAFLLIVVGSGIVSAKMGWYGAGESPPAPEHVETAAGGRDNF